MSFFNLRGMVENTHKKKKRDKEKRQAKGKKSV